MRYSCLTICNEDKNCPEHGFTVWFSKPVKSKTIHHSSVFLTAMVREPDSFFEDVLRLPVEEMQLIGEDSHGNARGVRLFFPEDWLHNQVHSDISRFNFPFSVELTVRGALIRDRKGCMMDGRPLDIGRHTHSEHHGEHEKHVHHDFHISKNGQEMPGDDFIVSFRVGNRPLGWKHHRKEK